MAVRAKSGAGARDGKIGAGDDAERGVKRHGQDAAQRGQRLPPPRMLPEISEVFVSRETEPHRRAIDHAVHRIREMPAFWRDDDDGENLDGFFGDGDAEYRMQHLRNKKPLGGCEDRRKRRTHRAQQRNAGGAEQKRGPDLGGRTGTFVGGDDEPQDQERRCYRRGADDGRKGFKKIHRYGKYAISLRYLSLRSASAARRG